MSYLVLARKYRPQTFEEIVGQEHVTRTLANAVAQGRIHHAFLFCGARGVGKTTAARILAKCVSCEKGPTPTPCNQCEACREITAGTSVDVQEIDGASNNSVDDVRTLREGIRYLPVRGKRKVYIIDEVHMLSTGAFNALLKTLEEPPEHALFIFATTEVHKVPVTILSRVQRYDFKLVSQARIAEHLGEVLAREGVKADASALALVAREAAGSVRDSLSLMEQVLAITGAAPGQALDEQKVAEALGVADRSLILDLGRAVLARDAATALSLVGAAAERAYDLKQLAHVFVEHLRNLVVARVVPDPSSLIDAPATELEALVATAKQAPPGLLELLFDRFVHVVDEATQSTVPRYVLEVGLVELCHVEPLEPVGQLVDRLEQLESRLAAGGHVARPSVSRVEVPRRHDAAPYVVTAHKAAPPVEPPAPPPPPPQSRNTATPSAPIPVEEAPRAPVSRPANWIELANAIFQRKPPLAVLLQGEQVSFDAHQIVVAFKPDFVEIARVRLPDALPLVRELVGEVRVEFVEGQGAAPSAIAEEEQRARADLEKRRQEALAHPARKLVTDTFGDGVTFQEPDVE